MPTAEVITRATNFAKDDDSSPMEGTIIASLAPGGGESAVKSIRIFALLSWVFPGILPVSSAAALGPPEDELVVKVQKAIAKASAFLRAKQTREGHWEGLVLGLLADQKGGTTALVTLALLNAGDKKTDPHMARALAYLRALPPERTYVVGLQTMVLAEVREARDLALIQRNVDWLFKHAIGLKDGKLQGWSYPGSNVPDNSNTQYALLGLYAAKQAGVSIEDDKWRLIQEYYSSTQKTESPTSGYWSYHNAKFGDKSASFTMSVAGVCGLIIAGMGLNASEQQLDEATGVARNCGEYAENTAFAKGMNWVAAHFNFDSPSAKSKYYNFYGIERLGRLSGQRFIGPHDWYREGCENLLRKQNPDGSFGQSGQGIDSVQTVATAFALLFLSKGRTPVLISKFAWGDFKDRGNGTFVEVGDPRPGVVNWNRKHHDLRHVVEYASRELFKGEPLAWQVYDVRRQDLAGRPDAILQEVGTLVQSPIVYITGHGVPRLSGVQKDILKRYVEEGGFLLAEACCGDAEFARGFQELMAEEGMFRDTPLRRVPPDHPLWRAFHDVSPADFPDLMCIERGCKTVVVFSPQPLSGYWEEARFMPSPGKVASNRGEKAFRLAGNIIAYATGLELPKPKLTVARIAKAEPDSGPPRSKLQAAQLKLTGESEPAPAAMRNLMNYLRDQTGLDVRLEKKSFYPGDEDLFFYKFMYMHGRRAFKLDEIELENLRSNLQTGGLLLADAACGKAEFDRAFRAIAAQLFPGRPLQVIPADDPLYSARLNGGQPITSVRCRREKADGTAEPEMRNYPPYLEGIQLDGRWVVIYSKYDLGCALEGHKSSDCLGHDKESALRLAAAAVLYALKR